MRRQERLLRVAIIDIWAHATRFERPGGRLDFRRPAFGVGFGPFGRSAIAAVALVGAAAIWLNCAMHASYLWLARAKFRVYQP